jgi:cellulose synthase/poly-beta-1,6-N-acetylglucosamine synthase-like glycosyltransferase
MDWLNFFTWFGIIYAILYTGSKLIFSIMSLLEIKVYFWRYDHVIEEHELKEHLQKNKHDMPMISIISPAYNEGILIVDTVSSFLNQSYKNKEVIICSDGGTDGTLEKLIEHFELVEVDDTFTHSTNITHKPIKRYFRSTNPRYQDLLVIDKENGGKADAQNAGVAIAKGEIVTIIDADSILEKYALIHLADIFERERRVVGIGTPIGVLNDCNVGPDGVDDASVPKSFWAKIQVIEYLRSFMLGRMYAQRYRGLQIISGAFGVYKKWILEAVNGYSTGSLAEDMDIDGKVWRYIDTNNLNYRIRYIPEAFCWSEVPDNFKSLASQRDRWARGMTETIWKNRDLFFNPKYKLLGMFSYPYYVFFEWLTPFIEIIGITYFIVGASLGWFSFYIVEYIFLLYWVIGILLNITAITVEAFTRGHYKNQGTLARLSFYAILEPLFYHWVNSYLYVTGNLKMLLFKKRGWGQIERKGIKKEEAQTIVHPEPAITLSPVGAGAYAYNADESNVYRKVHSFSFAPVENQTNGRSKKRLAGSPRVLSGALILILTSLVVWYYYMYTAQFTDRELEPEKMAVNENKVENKPDENVPGSELNESKNSNDTLNTSVPIAVPQLPIQSTSVVEPILSDSVNNETMIKKPVELVGPVIAGSIDTLSLANKQYHIIIASARNPEFIFEYAERLSKTGINSTIIPSYEGQEFTRLSVYNSNTFKEANNRLQELISEYGNEIWILKY